MTNIIIDTNIAFSAMLNINSRIGQILISGIKFYHFFAPEYIRTEILSHKEKIKSIGKLTENEFIEVYDLVLKGITILNHSLIPDTIYDSSEELCRDIDLDDSPFVAMGKFIGGKLWTGDKQLLNGLSKKNYKQIITTEELYPDFCEKERKMSRK